MNGLKVVWMCLCACTVIDYVASEQYQLVHKKPRASRWNFLQRDPWTEKRSPMNQHTANWLLKRPIEKVLKPENLHKITPLQEAMLKLTPMVKRNNRRYFRSRPYGRYMQPTRQPYKFGPPKGEDILNTTQTTTTEKTTTEYPTTTTTTTTSSTSTKQPTPTTTRKQNKKPKPFSRPHTTKYPLHAHHYTKKQHFANKLTKPHYYYNHHHHHHQTSTTTNLWPNIVKPTTAPTTTTEATNDTTSSYATRPRKFRQQQQHYPSHQSSNAVPQSFPWRMLSNARKMLGRFMSPLMALTPTRNTRPATSNTNHLYRFTKPHDTRRQPPAPVYKNQPVIPYHPNYVKEQTPPHVHQNHPMHQQPNRKYSDHAAQQTHNQPILHNRRPTANKIPYNTTPTSQRILAHGPPIGQAIPYDGKATHQRIPHREPYTNQRIHYHHGSSIDKEITHNKPPTDQRIAYYHEPPTNQRIVYNEPPGRSQIIAHDGRPIDTMYQRPTKTDELQTTRISSHQNKEEQPWIHIAFDERPQKSEIVEAGKRGLSPLQLPGVPQIKSNTLSLQPPQAQPLQPNLPHKPNMIMFTINDVMTNKAAPSIDRPTFVKRPQIVTQSRPTKRRRRPVRRFPPKAPKRAEHIQKATSTVTKARPILIKPNKTEVPRIISLPFKRKNDEPTPWSADQSPRPTPAVTTATKRSTFIGHLKPYETNDVTTGYLNGANGAIIDDMHGHAWTTASSIVTSDSYTKLSTS